ncbi:MAG: chemotaxis protein CheW [Deltaproteobacteria bacterium]|nr:chemotaxis protein CheW [Deltaproteobacteria bacterium]
MAQSASVSSNNNSMEFATFYIGDALCGMDILRIQEINKQMEMTRVPQAPNYVSGILNLRGQIVTVIDLNKKLGLTTTGSIKDDRRNIIVKSQEEYVGLLVDRISDVVKVDWDKVEPPPASMDGLQGKFFKGVYKTEKSLVGILEMEEVLKEDAV